MVNYFKPLIDTYQGPYKFKFDWSTAGNESCVVFFGLSALDMKINFTVGVTLLAAITIVQSKISPLNVNIKMLMIFQILYSHIKIMMS